MKFFLHDGHAPDGHVLLQPASLRALETVHSSLASRAGLPTGYGLANPPSGPQREYCRIYQRLWLQPRAGHGLCLSNNGGQRAPKLEQLVQAFLLRQLPPRGPAPAVPLDAAAVALYLGHYRSAAPRQELTSIANYLAGSGNLRRQGNLLLVEPLIGKAGTLLPTGQLTFRLPNQQTATIVLAQDKEGRRVLITSMPIAQADYALAVGFWWWLPPALLALSVLLIITSSLAALVGLVRVAPQASAGAAAAPPAAATGAGRAGHYGVGAGKPHWPPHDGRPPEHSSVRSRFAGAVGAWPAR